MVLSWALLSPNLGNCTHVHACWPPTSNQGPTTTYRQHRRSTLMGIAARRCSTTSHLPRKPPFSPASFFRQTDCRDRRPLVCFTILPIRVSVEREHGFALPPSDGTVRRINTAIMPEEGGNDRPTLIRPPPNDPDKAPIENVLDVLELSVFGPVSLSRSPCRHPCLRLQTAHVHGRTSSPTSGPCGIRQAHAASMAAP